MTRTRCGDDDGENNGGVAVGTAARPRPQKQLKAASESGEG